jgi:hypothetical protein
MPRYEITSPDGKKFEITAPDGATEEQVLSYAKEQFAAKAPEEPVQKQETAPQWQQSALNVAKGIVTGGPLMGPMTALAGESQKMLDRGAYDIGGKVTDVTGSPEAGFAANVATQAIPTVLGGIAGKTIASQPMQSAGKAVMQSALKPQSKDLLSGDAAKAVQTMLDEGVSVTPGGAAKLRGMITKLDAEVKAKIAASPAVVDKAHVMKEVHETLKTFRNQLNSASDEAAILKSWQETSNKLAAKIPVQTAQDLKQGTYKILSDKYAKIGQVENEAATQAQMAGARGLRKGIEEAVPGVGELNAKEAQLINALEMAERRVGVGGNRDIAGIAWLAQNPQAALAMMADRSSTFKSLLARLLYSRSKDIPTAVGAGTAGLYQGATQND